MRTSMDEGSRPEAPDAAPAETRFLPEERFAGRFYARILGRLRPDGGRLLDFGCRNGDLLRRVSERFESYGYDPSALARSRARLAAPEAVILEEWNSLPAESLDVIVSVCTLGRLARPLPVLEGLVGRLVQGGLFLLVVPNPGGMGRRLKGSSWFVHRERRRPTVRSQGEWAMLARQSGLEIDWVRGDGLWDPPYVGLLPLGLQRALFGAPTALQILSPLRRPLLPASFGECLIIAARKRKKGISPFS